MKLTKRYLRKIILEELAATEKTEESAPDDLGKDLEAAYAAGPGAVRTFMDAQDNKDGGVKDILVSASEENDGSDPDDKIAVSGGSEVSVGDLGPTQQFIDLMQSVSFPLGSASVLEDAITSKTSGAPGAISISGNAVLDGHHRWSSVFAITPDGSINAKDFQFPGGVKEKLAAAQLAVAAINKGGTQPSKGGAAATDIIGKGKEDIIAMIDSNKGSQTDDKAPGPLLNDTMIQAIADGNHPAILEWAGLTGEEEFVSLDESEAGFANDPIRKGIAEKVGENLASLPSPLDGAPASREDMPQLDHESIGGSSGLAQIEKGLPAGEFNVVPPFQKEGRYRRKITRRQLRRIIKEEWHSDEHETLADKMYADSKEPEWTEGDYWDAIRDFSKELTGRRNTYGSPEKLAGMDDKQLSDYYTSMFDSPEAITQQDEIEAADKVSAQAKSDAGIGYEYEESEQERSPKRQGMSRRQESVSRVMDIIREELQREIRLRRR